MRVIVIMNIVTTPNLPVLSFASMDKWDEWLSEHHTDPSGIWIKFYKKNSGVKSLSYLEAVEVGLCYGWIDSQSKKFDEKSYLQKFTPRRSKSIWSKINTERIERLIKEGKMKPSGLKVVAEAKENGRWVNAYDSPSNIILPSEFVERLSKNKKAEQIFKNLDKTNRYAIAWRIQTAKKPETKIRRIEKILEMLQNGEKFH